MKHKPTARDRAFEIVTRDVDNPYFAPEHPVSRSNPRQTAATINVKESAVETMFARGVLDMSQKRAADRFRQTWEAMGGAGASAMDYAREVVDGGRTPDPINERQIDAGKSLAACRARLGARMYDLVCKICGEGLALDEICQSKREKLTAADNLRHSLDDLAEIWNLKTGR